MRRYRSSLFSRIDEDSDSLFFLGAGPLAAVVLGVLLIPFRETTTASNLTFLFLALIIGVAELAGRWAAVATAVTSSFSLNFFLTQPYLRLAIHDRDDIIAVFGLALCGLIAAAFGSRGRKARDLVSTGDQSDLLHAMTGEIAKAGPVEARLEKLLEASRNVFPISEVVVRDRHERSLGASDRGRESRTVPQLVLDADTMLSAGAGPSAARERAPLPAEGARVELVFGNARVGWLDLWGDGTAASSSERRTLSDFARLTAVLVSQGTEV